MRFFRILRIAGCVCVAALASATQAQEGKNSQASSAPAATHEEAHYVGTEVCKTCHEEIFNNFEKTPHFKTTLDTHLTHGKQGCEGCHGPGSAHVDGGGDKTKIFVFPKHSAKEIRSLRLRACRGENGGLPGVPHAARIAERASAEGK